ncbi:hypothetical protein [Roseivirga seohaensis]|uniref:Uncharacterized protein n=1 Tax=Roseivirga seohaensis TaxID=1914963 RepID=A0A150XLZ6_9BACT|nr:hypothetical protein [Roseivirga seohaensis]KYG79769.1 hypothetical protein AWW67_10640 [Roseivirga seohaensis]
MRKLSLIFMLTFIAQQMVNACELCKEKQPKALAEITHGAGPNGTLDYIIIWSAVIIVSLTFFYSIKYLVKPEKADPQHIKNIVTQEYF